MKPLTSAKIAGAAALMLLLFVSCTKVGLDQIDNEEIIGGQKIKESKCDLLSFSYPDYYGNGQRFMFNRTYDHIGGKLTFIKVGLYSGGGITDTAFLNIAYGTDVVYFVNAKNALDTAIVAYLNKAGRVIKIELGNDVNGSQLKYSPSPQEFYYKNGQLQQIYINSVFGFFFRYDQFDNLTQIVTDTTSLFPSMNHRYEYDYSRKAKDQYYQDEARGFSLDVFSVLHAAGYFPETDPVHLRTRTTVNWGPYVAYDYDLINHVIDRGQLVSYQTTYHNYNSPGPPYTIEWACKNN